MYLFNPHVYIIAGSLQGLFLISFSLRMHFVLHKCGSCEVAFFFAGSAFDIFALYSCRAPEDEHRNVTVADVWTLEGEHLPNYMVRAGLLLQVEDMCVGVLQGRDERDDQCRAYIVEA